MLNNEEAVGAVAPLLKTSSTISVNVDDVTEVSPGEIVVELVSDSSETGEKDGCPVRDVICIFSVSRLSVVPPDIAVGVSVL